MHGSPPLAQPPARAPQRVAVVMTTYETPQALDQVLAGYAAQSRRPDQVVVADDGSGDTTRAVVERWRAAGAFELIHVWQPNNGYRRSRILNMGIAASDADYFIFTDGDCLPHRHFVRDHLRLAQTGFWVQGKRAQIREGFARQATAADASGLVLWWRGWLWRSRYGIRWPIPIVWRQTEGPLRERALGSNMAMWATDLRAINGFNEAFVGWGSEDREITVRLHNLGRRKKFVLGRALQYHLDHPPTSRQHAKDNGEILNRVRSQALTRCDQGLDAHSHVDGGAALSPEPARV
jgi:glycosyltransferase involved in cell wall biosynthesis